MNGKGRVGSLALTTLTNECYHRERSRAARSKARPKTHSQLGCSLPMAHSGDLCYPEFLTNLSVAL
ncbi:MAG: hypothetical protein [Bacteriophage sp.]|nr:MAG: hypothetical protein [Bacteriophage sp.]